MAKYHDPKTSKTVEAKNLKEAKASMVVKPTKKKKKVEVE